jgi:hypothetical protein
VEYDQSMRIEPANNLRKKYCANRGSTLGRATVSLGPAIARRAAPEQQANDSSKSNYLAFK